MKFNINHLKEIKDNLNQKNEALNEILEKDYAELFQAGPFQEQSHVDKIIATILRDKKVRDTLNLNQPNNLLNINYLHPKTS